MERRKVIYGTTSPRPSKPSTAITAWRETNEAKFFASFPYHVRLRHLHQQNSQSTPKTSLFVIVTSIERLPHRLSALHIAEYQTVSPCRLSRISCWQRPKLVSSFSGFYLTVDEPPPKILFLSRSGRMTYVAQALPLGIGAALGGLGDGRSLLSLLFVEQARCACMAVASQSFQFIC